MFLFLNLERYQFDFLFPEINNRKTFIKVKLKLLEYLQLWSGNKEIKRPFVCFDLDNLHRAFLVNHDGHKIISFTFDFSIKTCFYDYNINNHIERIHYNGVNGCIEARNISEAQVILSKYSTRKDNLYNEIEFDEEDCIAPESFRLFEYLLFREDGYIRYDYDTKGFKPDIHPLNHFDINYSEFSHYKLGLDKMIDINEFMEILDKNKVCSILNSKPQKKNVPPTISAPKKRGKKRKK